MLLTRKWFTLFRLLFINFILLPYDVVLIVEQFRDARTKEASIEALVKLHRSYSENLGVLVARYYIRFHPRNSCCQRNFKFLRHPTFDGDVDTIDDLLSRSESALSSLWHHDFQTNFTRLIYQKIHRTIIKKRKKGRRLRISIFYRRLHTDTNLKERSFSPMYEISKILLHIPFLMEQI